MSNIVVRFYKKINDTLVVVRQEVCYSLIEADTLADEESDHYDKIVVGEE